MRILQLVSNRWWTGTADPVLSVSRELRQLGFQVYLGCTPGDSLERRAREMGFTPLPRLCLDTKRPYRFYRDLFALSQVVRREQIDIVHTHLSHDHWLAACLRCITPPSRFRLVRTIHNRRSIHRDSVHRWLFRSLTDHLFTVSHSLRADLCHNGNIEEEKITVIPGGVDTRRFHPAIDGQRIRQEYQLAATVPIVGIVARLVPSRGHLALLEALRIAVDRQPNIRLFIVGKGEYLPIITQRVKEQKLDQYVIFTGYRDHDLPEVLAAMNVFVLLHGGSEGSGRALLEAMAMGKACIAGAEGALAENIEHQDSGWVVDPANPAEIAEAMLTLLGDPARAEEMGRKARRRVTEYFTEENRAKTIAEVYQRLCTA